jgi:predicted HAD superfamily phosphohydrolase
MVPQVKDAISSIMNDMVVYLVSTSYRHYIEAVAEYLGLDLENTFSTVVLFDDYQMEKEEAERVISFQKRLLSLPDIIWDDNMDIPEGSRYAIRVLKDFFFSILPELPVYRWMKGIEPVGGPGKVEAISTIVKNHNTSLSDIIYVGDSITDIDAFLMVRENGGISVSFNGNRYAVKNAEYIVISNNAWILAELVHDYIKYGRNGIKTGVIDDNRAIFRKGERDIEEVVRLSEKARKELRGEAIGGLGEAYLITFFINIDLLTFLLCNGL